MGASLLAKRPSASTSMLTDTPLSRAGSLPQGIASSKQFLSEPCPRQIVIYSELARDYLKRHGEPHYEH
ncbi:hypothetical protein EAH74_06360 [Pseudomonas mandelii]|uniref:Uncharacterized protein n=1 Tax=Pseudomonas mandelii TaxID=75612 RepID=A0A502IK45_9PSED|nr:hypothetical protein EAH74_06360 [Pseudomonas mandelii]